MQWLLDIRNGVRSLTQHAIVLIYPPTCLSPWSYRRIPPVLLRELSLPNFIRNRYSYSSSSTTTRAKVTELRFESQEHVLPTQRHTCLFHPLPRHRPWIFRAADTTYQNELYSVYQVWLISRSIRMPDVAYISITGVLIRGHTYARVELYPTDATPHHIN